MTDATKRLGGPVAVLLALGALFFGLRAAGPGGAADGDAMIPDTLARVPLVGTTDVTAATDGVVDDASDGTARATFAGGCFWCMEPPFDELEGVRSTVSGFAGGQMVDPTYDQVASGRTDHREVVQVIYDPTTVSYTRLLEVYWHNVDPFDGGGQFCDRGHQYSPAIFHHNAEQAELARASLERLRAAVGAPPSSPEPASASGGDGGESGGSGGDASGPAVAVELAPLDAFYAAEAYHQDFYEKNPERYYSYRDGCRRDERLRQVWGDRAGHQGTGPA